jgi:GTPase SAR1 family protein
MTLARHNPFRTQRLEAINFRPQGTSWSCLMDRLETMNFRCAVVGPHGSGKTTLFEQLAEKLNQQGHQIAHVRINEVGQCWGCPSLDQWVASLNTTETVLFDGANHLPRRMWYRLRQHNKLIITSHTTGLLPTLITTQTSEAMLRELVREIVDDATYGELEDRICHVYQQSDGNLRTAFLSLYDAVAAV